jgi:hypothetical protein
MLFKFSEQRDHQPIHPYDFTQGSSVLPSMLCLRSHVGELVPVGVQRRPLLS